MWSSIRKKRNEWVDHILRHGELLGLIIERCVEVKNCRSRRHLEYIQQIVKGRECNSYEEMKRMASDREEWRAAVNQSRN